MTYAVLDIETSGLDPVVNEPIEVAYILLPEMVEEEFSLPFDESRADPKALEVNGFSDGRNMPSYYTQHTGANRIASDLEGRIVIGKNVQFDLNFLREFLRRQGHENVQPWHYSPIDLKSMVLGYAAPGRIPDNMPEFLRAYINTWMGDRLTGEDEHTAMGDARWNLRLWNLLIAN